MFQIIKDKKLVRMALVGEDGISSTVKEVNRNQYRFLLDIFWRRGKLNWN